MPQTIKKHWTKWAHFGFGFGPIGCHPMCETANTIYARKCVCVCVSDRQTEKPTSRLFPFCVHVFCNVHLQLHTVHVAKFIRKHQQRQKQLTYYLVLEI